ncbi:hypothetical protein BC938DRAFT_481826 [Jimgerdemannia flammicorona]|uniref:Uncharacterized protein n=1 Tax=Jimgerdemannia flammicorona TaxID=994334 RepID=A0A433QFC0_9FUNG|nr:hypothetical protein BC938DRAFT_481826 [Jimgerdemannia flammicorona]
MKGSKRRRPNSRGNDPNMRRCRPRSRPSRT